MFLHERMYDVVSDVDMIYDKFFKAYVDDLEAVSVDSSFRRQLYDENPITIGSLLSSEFTDMDCLKAHLTNPITLTCGIGLKNGSFYNPTRQIIQISVQSHAILYQINPNRYSHLNKQMITSLSNEFTEGRIKGTIDHELTHWVDDTLNNGFLSKIIYQANEFNKPELLLLGKEDVNLTYFEIQGQMGNIRQAQRKNAERWDSMTLHDLFEIIPPLMAIYNRVSQKYSSKIVYLWQRHLIQRMNRENLLGKSMRKFIK